MNGLNTMFVESYVAPFLKGNNRHRTAARASLRAMAKRLDEIKGDKYITRRDGKTWPSIAETGIADLESKDAARVEAARENLGWMLAAFRGCQNKYGQE